MVAGIVRDIGVFQAVSWGHRSLSSQVGPAVLRCNNAFQKSRGTRCLGLRGAIDPLFSEIETCENRLGDNVLECCCLDVGSNVLVKCIGYACSRSMEVYISGVAYV